VTGAGGASFIDVGELRIRVSEQGRGARPLLLVPGIGTSLEIWPPLLDALGDLRTLTFDPPGAGRSSVPRLPIRLPRLARVVTDVLDALGHEQVDLLGVSWGGALAQQIAHQAPGRVRRLVLAATSCGLGSVPGHPVAVAAIANPLRFYSRWFFELVAPHVYGGAVRRSQLQRSDDARLWLRRPPSFRGYAYQLMAITGWSSLPWLHRLPQPTLVMAGAEDPLIPLRNARILASRIPRAAIHVVEDGGHLFLLNHAAQSAAVIREFLGEPAVQPPADHRLLRRGHRALR
jgi:poly(3-hydroxyalkanoate) depolymerase